MHCTVAKGKGTVSGTRGSETARERRCLTSGMKRRLAAWGAAGNGGVLAAKAVEPRGRGSILAAKAAETPKAEAVS